MTLQYAKDRIAFGRPIGSFQAVKHQLADTSLAVEMSKAVALAAAVSVGADDGYGPSRRQHRQGARRRGRRRTGCRPASRSSVASATPGSTTSTSSSAA